MSIEAVREPGKPTAVTWARGYVRLRMEGSGFVTEVKGVDGWMPIVYSPIVRANDVITAYRIHEEGLEPPEGFEVECEGGFIKAVDRVRGDAPRATVMARGAGTWEFCARSLTSEDLQQLVPILAEIAEQEESRDA